MDTSPINTNMNVDSTTESNNLLSTPVTSTLPVSPLVNNVAKVSQDIGYANVSEEVNDIANLPTDKLDTPSATVELDPRYEVDEYEFEGNDSSNEKKRRIVKIGLILFILALVCIAIFLIYTVISRRANSNGANTNSASSSTTLISQQTVSTTSQQVTKTTLRVWGMWENADVIKPTIEAFNQQYPNVTIEYANREGINNTQELYKASLLSKFVDAKDSLPDIFIIQQSWTDQMQEYLYPSTTAGYTATDYRNTFYPAFAEAFVRGENVYAVPIGFDGLGVYYNKELLQAQGYSEPAEDWDGFTEQVKKLTKKDSNGNLLTSGLSAGPYNNVGFFFDPISLLMMQSGKLQNDKGELELTTSVELLDAVNFYMKYYSESGGIKSWDANQDLDVKAFAEGKLAMMFGPLWRINEIKKYYPDLNVGISTMPQISDSNVVNYSNSWGYAVYNGSANKAVAWEFLRFITEKEQLASMYQKATQTRVVGQAYPRIDMANLQQDIEYVGAYIQMAPTARSWPMYSYEDAQKIFKSELGSKGRVDSLAQIEEKIIDLKK